MKIQIALVTSLMLLSSCGSIQRAETAKTAQASMVGMSKEQVLACMGVPAQQLSQGETEVWVYASRNGERTVALRRDADSGRIVGSSTASFCKI